MFWRELVNEENIVTQENLASRIKKDKLSYTQGQSFVAMLICLEEEQENFSKELLSFTCENILREIVEKDISDWNFCHITVMPSLLLFFQVQIHFHINS